MATYLSHSEFTQLASEDGFRRIREYSLPLESERTQRVYGQASAINKLLIVSGEAYPGRITMVLVKQQLGF